MSLSKRGLCGVAGTQNAVGHTVASLLSGLC